MSLVNPHGGVLKNLFISDQTLVKDKETEAQNLIKIPLTSREISDTMMLASGAYSPLDGFMMEDEYKSVVHNMRLPEGTLFALPVTLNVQKELAGQLQKETSAALYDPGNKKILGTILIKDVYHYDKQQEAREIFTTSDESHPGVAKIYSQGDWYVGGSVEIFNNGQYLNEFCENAFPAETRMIFQDNNWQTIAAFQTRNPIHRSHEYLTKIALEVCDGLLIHPVTGQLKPGDLPAEVRMKCYQTIIDNYYPQQRVVLKALPLEMRYAGPREALLHAIIRQNFGCSHIIIGRDHAGVGEYYGHYDAQNIFDQLNKNDLQIKPLKMDDSYWCKKCSSIVSKNTCPHDEQYQLKISGTKLRNMLKNDEAIPSEICRPEVVDILKENYYN